MKTAVVAFVWVVMLSLSARAHPGTQVMIDLSNQQAVLLQNGQIVLISPIASGKDGWTTPIGNFSIVRKDQNHQSGSFGSVLDRFGRVIDLNATPRSYVPPGCHYVPAPMPYFMEFAKNIGMHAGYLPGYPASHGCVRMPHDLAQEFYDRVWVGTRVRVLGDSHHVTHVRRAIPIHQPADLIYPGYDNVFARSRTTGRPLKY
ncbi:MAG: L,D-transpeptidase [Verrucomicrobia bacterium]|nr:L,D-transpeptidase [Verrucomicrobiota bacterium]